MTINLTDFIDLITDCSRRDLTINSIAKDIETGEYIDPFNGRSDIERRILRHTSDAFSEDPLRVIRLARFAARYPFFIADDTILLSRKMVQAGALNELPYERFWTEIEKVMTGADSSKFFTFLFDDLDVQKHVNFFSDLFGQQTMMNGWFEKLIKAVHKIPVELRTIVFCALAAQYSLDKNMKGAHSQMIALHKNIRAVYGVNSLSQINDIFDILKMSKVWGQGPHYENLKLAVGISDPIFGAGGSALTETVLQDLQRVVLEVKSEHFAPLEGKALGDAIEAARKQKIKTMVESYV